jgi:outer membrane receptor protein involved in Fe transport
LPSQLSFNPETDVNFETGYKADVLDHRLKIDADVFYLYRQDAQIKSSFQSDPTNPDYFVYYTGNAASGRNYGLESDAEWRATDRVTLGADLGLLQTHFENFMQQQGSSGATSVSVSRELANAPHWQAAVNATYRDPRGPFARVDVTGMGGVLLRSAAELHDVQTLRTSQRKDWLGDPQVVRVPVRPQSVGQALSGARLLFRRRPAEFFQRGLYPTR